ncbi:acyl-CoA thioesterase [Flavobacterium aciduliphilum]|uniref:Acyl-CoA thioester hydrolase n=1 Tax=Flavobacterium aciduliphilum TaxID=1101402 RepID=A0A328YSL9_9FLAO|nr:thioesterase family protein [Flavobacterium aciduliphilum]RAR75775.1 acyl-CoA thioester hydrolase [Flavobacterium aciduliphilum]
MDKNKVTLRVRYGETDQMGVVYHGSYVPYFEIGRVEWLRNRGISYKSLEEDGIALPIVSMHLNYKKPARYDDILTITTKMRNYSGVKIEFDCEIHNENEELLTIAYFILVFVATETGKPIVPPQYVLDVIKKED